MNKNEKQYNNMMKLATKEMKKVNDTFTKAEYDLIVTHRCQYDGFLWQKELVSEMKLYITYLGLIDALILNEKKKMNWYIEFKDDKRYKKHEEKYNYYMEQRKKLLIIIDSNTKIRENFRFIGDILGSIPASNEFYRLYKDMDEGEYQFDLQLQFINAYNTGFMQRFQVNYEYISNQFEKYNKEIEEHRENNKQQIAQLKLSIQGD